MWKLYLNHVRYMAQIHITGNQKLQVSTRTKRTMVTSSCKIKIATCYQTVITKTKKPFQLVSVGIKCGSVQFGFYSRTVFGLITHPRRFPISHICFRLDLPKDQFHRNLSCMDNCPNTTYSHVLGVKKRTDQSECAALSGDTTPKALY